MKVDCALMMVDAHASARQHESLRGWSVLEPLNRGTVTCLLFVAAGGRRTAIDVGSEPRIRLVLGTPFFISTYHCA